jgi:uncharacterized protein YraI
MMFSNAGGRCVRGEELEQLRRPMRHLIVTFASLAVLPSALLAQVDTGFAYTTANVWLRDAPAATAKAIQTIPKGTRVSVAECAEEWCAVGFRTHGGFVYERYLTRDSAAVQVIQQGRGYINARGEWIRSPQRTTDGRAPVGASAKCRDGTYSFSRSRRGTCSHHGGVSQWLP